MTRIQDRVVIEGHRARSFAVGAGAAASSGPLRKGMHAVWADSGDIFIRVARITLPGGAAAVAPDRAEDVTATDGYVIKAGAVEQVDIDDGRALGAFSTAGTTVRIHRIGD